MDIKKQNRQRTWMQIELERRKRVALDLCYRENYQEAIAAGETAYEAGEFAWEKRQDFKAGLDAPVKPASANLVETK